MVKQNVFRLRTNLFTDSHTKRNFLSFRVTMLISSVIFRLFNDRRHFQTGILQFDAIKVPHTNHIVAP